MLKDAWALAIETISQIELQKLSERLALAKTTKLLGIGNPNAIRYGYGLVVETVRRKILIDKFIESVTKPKTLSEFSLNVQAFLRLYVYHTRVTKNWADPDVGEAERIAKLGRAILGWKKLRSVEPFLGFLLTRQVEPLMRDLAGEELTALQTFHPVWFVKYCYRLFGRKDATAFLEGSVYPPPSFIRLNTLKAAGEEIVAKLEAEGVKLERIESLKHTFRVRHADRPLTSTVSYAEGFFYVQDKASCFAAEVADPKPGMTVLDACAAPGAKTTYLAQLMHNQGIIYSLDFSARRMKTWKQENRRMDITISEPIVADVRCSIPPRIEFDIVVLDPPCTSTGVFGRQPSAKWRLTPRSIETMAEIQWQMIKSVAEKVKSGGVLTYSTCSVTVEENELLIERFMKWHPEFNLRGINPKLGLPGLRGLTNCRRLYPHLHESNGFFIAKLARD